MIACGSLRDVAFGQAFIFGWLFGAFVLGIIVAVILGRLLHKIGEARLVTRLRDYDTANSHVDPYEIFHHEGP